MGCSLPEGLVPPFLPPHPDPCLHVALNLTPPAIANAARAPWPCKCLGLSPAPSQNPHFPASRTTRAQALCAVPRSRRAKCLLRCKPQLARAWRAQGRVPEGRTETAACFYKASKSLQVSERIPGGEAAETLPRAQSRARAGAVQRNSALWSRDKALLRTLNTFK